MEFRRLLEFVENEPVFESSLLMSGKADPMLIRQQLSRWVAAGKIIQLRRELYCLAPPYQKVRPHPFLVANRLQPGSYVSLQSALAYHGMIPENVPATTSVTTGRPESLKTFLGEFYFRHIQVKWLRGYRQVDLGNDQRAFVAKPEKALLDLVYLQPGGDAIAYLQGLRLQALEKLDLDELGKFVSELKRPRLIRAEEVIRKLVGEEKLGYVQL
jgi:predicted transcriptional regulator of viral defense system